LVSIGMSHSMRRLDFDPLPVARAAARKPRSSAPHCGQAIRFAGCRFRCSIGCRREWSFLARLAPGWWTN